MNLELLPDLLRGLASSVMIVLIMLTLLQPKYSQKTNYVVLACVMLADFIVAWLCYVYGNLTLLAGMDVILFTVVCIAIKPFYKDTFMQWLFSYITVMNIGIAIVILSFAISRVLPLPAYANTAVRLVLYLLVFFLLRFKVRPLYREVVERWSIFFYVAAAIFVCLIYSILADGDILWTLSERTLPLIMLVALATVVYVSIFHTMKTMSKEYALREQALQAKSQQELLRLSIDVMEQRIESQEEVFAINRKDAHDRHHFNQTLLELLRQGNTAETMNLLRQQQDIVAPLQQIYCENAAVNAVVTHYARLCKEHRIVFTFELDIPPNAGAEQLELSLVTSNLLENAVNACSTMPLERRFIRFRAIYTGRLFYDIENSYAGEVEFDNEGNPSTRQGGHGVGTKNVVAFATKQQGIVEYQAKNGVFRVRLQM